MVTTLLFFLFLILFPLERTAAQRKKREHHIPSDDTQDQHVETGMGDRPYRRHNGGHQNARGKLRFRGDYDPNAGSEAERAMQHAFEAKQRSPNEPPSSLQLSHTSYVSDEHLPNFKEAEPMDENSPMPNAFLPLTEMSSSAYQRASPSLQHANPPAPDVGTASLDFRVVEKATSMRSSQQDQWQQQLQQQQLQQQQLQQQQLQQQQLQQQQLQQQQLQQQQLQQQQLQQQQLQQQQQEIQPLSKEVAAEPAPALGVFAQSLRDNKIPVPSYAQGQQQQQQSKKKFRGNNKYIHNIDINDSPQGNAYQKVFDRGAGGLPTSLTGFRGGNEDYPRPKDPEHEKSSMFWNPFASRQNEKPINNSPLIVPPPPGASTSPTRLQTYDDSNRNSVKLESGLGSGVGEETNMERDGASTISLDSSSSDNTPPEFEPLEPSYTTSKPQPQTTVASDQLPTSSPKRLDPNLVVIPGSHTEDRSPDASVTPVEHSYHRFLDKRAKDTLRRHNGIIEVVLIGDSILSHIQRDGELWEQFSRHYRAMNLGSPGDRTEHVLFRLDVDSIISPLVTEARAVVVMIGANNVGIGDNADSVFRGIKAVTEKVRKKFSSAQVIVLGMLPRASQALTSIISLVNKRLETQYMGAKNVHFVNLFDQFSTNGKASEKMFMPDHVHPSKAGYMKIIDTIVPILDGKRQKRGIEVI